MDQPARLPRGAQARIPTGKLVRYALNPGHERGCHKARVFTSTLGITASDWRLFSRNKKAREIERPRTALVDAGRLRRQPGHDRTTGRPAEIWIPVRA
jgi:hypothetical protein